MNVDVALLQEATAPPPDVASRVSAGEEPWTTPGDDGLRPWRAAVVKLSPDVDVEWLRPGNLGTTAPGEFAVSRTGTLALARVSGDDVFA